MGLGTTYDNQEDVIEKLCAFLRDSRGFSPPSFQAGSMGLRAGWEFGLFIHQPDSVPILFLLPGVIPKGPSSPDLLGILGHSLSTQ